jgi:DNA-binding LytR/AlgR family response regulator
MEKELHKQTMEKEIIKSHIFLQNDQKIVLKEKSINHFITMDSVTHLICDCYLTTVHTSAGSKYVISRLLKDFETDLGEYGFVRVNRNTIVNTLHVVSYGNGGNRMVSLSNNITISISRRGMARLKEAIGS